MSGDQKVEALGYDIARGLRAGLRAPYKVETGPYARQIYVSAYAQAYATHLLHRTTLLAYVRAAAQTNRGKPSSAHQLTHWLRRGICPQQHNNARLHACGLCLRTPFP